MLNLGVASSLLQSIEKYVSSNMLLIDMEGKIMSGPKVMRGKTNALARQLVSGAEEMVVVHPDDPNNLKGYEAGVYIVLNVNQARIGVLAMLGTGEELLATANIVKICIEKSLELELAKQERDSDKEQHIRRLIYFPNPSKQDIDYLIRITHIRPEISRVPILFVVHQADNGPKENPELVRKAILQSEAYLDTDFLCRTLDDNIIWFKTVAPEKRLCFLAEKEILDEQINQMMATLNNIVFSAYIGPILDKLYNYGQGYRQCEWMRLDICVLGIYYFYNYLLRYLHSKMSRSEYDTMLSAISEEMDKNARENFCEIMEALIQCDYNFSLVAQKLFVHKNTVIYRFDKIRNLFQMNPLLNGNERVYLEILYYYFKTYSDATGTTH